ncbi:MAG: LysR family transcriptional regulator [Hydrogenophaga sp.]|uniref:LysR family transcriptional regulator n=1 Tax=Hydrogenophaga sp. TaxID=1904254 RepID=UPI002722671A|nr:LysR family transcriptional regulator [Hydrogenophaga sp.]MDO9505390.1 LysR family transcriptional regulator [Hydrogenophaga sp.]MDP3202673.1 LysR family transcriptional regulator [Hydrogenophaga sp.]MDP3628467.1 LysR family transcriptional regulator [Hydrogenophaga sp.]
MNRHITLKQFRYFLAVAESDSVAAASRMLSIAQSAITKSVLELEDELGLVLFERSPKGMRLTPEGHRFQVKARRVIGAVADATRGVYPSATPLAGGALTIGVTSLVAGYYLSEVFARFRRTCPGVDLKVVEDAPPFLEHLLINGELDIAIMVSNALGEPQALMAETLTRSPNRVWMAADHPLAPQSEVSLAECVQHDLVVLQADRIEVLMRSVWARHQLKPRTVLRTSSLEAVRSLVGVGAGLAVLPDFLYRPWTLDAEHVEVRTLRDAVPTVDVGLVWRRGSQPRAEVLEFIEVARDQSRSRRPVA